MTRARCWPLRQALQDDHPLGTPRMRQPTYRLSHAIALEGPCTEGPRKLRRLNGQVDSPFSAASAPFSLRHWAGTGRPNHAAAPPGSRAARSRHRDSCALTTAARAGSALLGGRISRAGRRYGRPGPRRAAEGDHTPAGPAPPGAAWPSPRADPSRPAICGRGISGSEAIGLPWRNCVDIAICRLAMDCRGIAHSLLVSSISALLRVHGIGRARPPGPAAPGRSARCRPARAGPPAPRPPGGRGRQDLPGRTGP